MATVTTLIREPRKRFVTVAIDDNEPFELLREIVAEAGLRLGRDVDEVELGQIAYRIGVRAATLAAGRLLEIRPRATKELSTALKRKGFTPDVIEGSIAKLTQMGLVDDTQFATIFIESRGRSHPQSVRLTRGELAMRGVTRPNIDTAIAGMAEIDELALAKAALAKRVRTIPDDPDERRAAFNRHASFLARRGFGWDIVRKALGEVFNFPDIDEI